MERWKRKSIELLSGIAFGGEKISVVPYEAQKLRISGGAERFFPRTIPEWEGISSARIYDMLSELEREERAVIHSIKVIRRGRVICECSAPGYEGDLWHISHSMSKSVLAMVIGALVDAGRLRIEQRLTEIFPELAYRDKKFPHITIEQLLSMTAGVEFAEIGTITESDWLAAFFSSALRFTPGRGFYYNSMNSYVLGRVAERITGESLGLLADRLIFAPLGIESFLWEKGPCGREKGGWGLYLSSESWGKLGVMMLAEGKFMGRQILSPKWVRAASSTQAIPPPELGSFDYGYHIWVGRGNRELLFNGMLGQNVWISRRNQTVVVMSCGNDELFQESAALRIVRKYLGGDISDEIDPQNSRALIDKQESFFDSRRWVIPQERHRGLPYLLGVRSRTPFDTAWEGILGSYAFGDNNLGMLPLVVRVMQNSLDCRIHRLSLVREGERLMMLYTEGGEDFAIAIGLYGYAESVICVRGESYIVRAIGRALIRPSGVGEYRIELVFPETACVRRLTLARLDEGRVELSFGESPGEGVASGYLNSLSGSNPLISFAVEMLERRFGRGVVAGAISQAFSPRLIGADMICEDYLSVVESENARRAEERKKLRFLIAVVDRFFKDK